jgi:hypothetical protein
METGGLQARRGRAFGVGVAHQEETAGGIVDTVAGVGRSDDLPLVVERELTVQPLLLIAQHPGRPFGGLDLEERTRRRVRLLEAQVVGKVETRHVRDTEELAEQLVFLRCRHRHLLAPQQRGPGEGSVIAQGGDAVGPEDKSAGNQQHGRLQRQPFGAAPQLTLQDIPPAGCVRRHGQPEIPGTAVVPAQRRELCQRIR